MDEAEEKLWRWSGYRRSVSIVADKTDQTDSITGEKLDRIYMKVVQEPKFKTPRKRRFITLTREAHQRKLNHIGSGSMTGGKQH